MTKKYCIYKCVFGNYDIVLPPLIVSPICDYLVITDDANFSAPGWKKQIVSVEQFASPKTANLFFRALYHKQLTGYEASLYLDGNIQIAGDVAFLFEEFVNRGVALGLQLHPDRRSVEEEVKACIRLSLLKRPEDGWVELESYRSFGFPDNIGLFESNIIFKNHRVIGLDDAMSEWYDEFCKFRQRDQISLPYVIWKSGVSYSSRSYGLRDPRPEYFFLYPHSSSTNLLDWMNAYIRAHRYNRGLWPFVNIGWSTFQFIRAKVAPVKRLRRISKG